MACAAVVLDGWVRSVTRIAEEFRGLEKEVLQVCASVVNDSWALFGVTGGPLKGPHAVSGMPDCAALMPWVYHIARCPGYAILPTLTSPAHYL